MKKTVTILGILGSAFILLDTINAGHFLMLFLLAGVVPGTNILISPVDMMAANATAITVVVLRIAFWAKIRDAFFIPLISPVRTTRKTRRSARI